MAGLDFEKALDDFIARHEYDQAANALYSMVRIAFRAGWNAALGDAAGPEHVVRLLQLDMGKRTDDDIETDIAAVSPTAKGS